MAEQKKLKPKQLAFIEALIANPMITDVALAEQLGVNRNTIREWKKNPLFQEEYAKRLKEKWEDSERMAVETMQKLASEYDFKAAKYILDSLGYAPVQKVEADVKTTIEINIEE